MHESILKTRPRRGARTPRVRVRSAFVQGGSGGVGRAPYAYPGAADTGIDDTRDALLTGALATFVHAAVVGALVWLAAMNPVIVEKIIPVRILRDEPTEIEPAPAPKALAERRMANFAPRAQTVAPQVINPRVVAEAAPHVPARALDLDTLEATRAPTSIDHAPIEVEHLARVGGVAASRSASVKVPDAMSTGVRGPVRMDTPTGPSVGPREIAVASPEHSIGTGTLTIGSGSSVREGVASHRDVLGAPDGEVLVSVETSVGEGYWGTGGTGTGIASGVRATTECSQRPEVGEYLEVVRQRTYDRWNLPPGIDNNQVKLRFKIDVAGSASDVEIVAASHNALGASAVDAMRAASPFPPLPEAVRCLTGKSIVATFASESGSG